MDKFNFSQSALKDLEKPETCPYRWNSQWILGEFKSPSNIYMDRGRYFEYLCLGGGANPDDNLTDLPRLLNGNKGKDQIRIGEQADRFKELFDPKHKDWLGFNIIDKQIRVTDPVKNRSGVIDFTASRDDNFCIIDLKLTGNLYRPGGWWGDLDAIDWIQQTHYHDLYRSENDDSFWPAPSGNIDDYLAVFDYSTKKNIKVIKLDITKKDIDNVHNRFDTAEKVVDLYNKHGWVKDPSVNECKNCPLDCDERITE